MQFQALALFLLACTGLATPVRRDVTQKVYALRLSSPVTSLNGVYLTTSPDGTLLGVYSPRDPQTPTIKFYPVRNPSTGLSELRTVDSGAPTTLAVVGTNGLLDFASLDDPASVTVPVGTTIDWTSFMLDESEGVVKYAGKGGSGAKGRWAVFPAKGGTGNGWTVKWKDANAWSTENYMPVKVVYELVKDE